MKSTPHFFSLLTICFMLLIANTDALAQKKPKLKGIAKELVGTWILADMELKLDEATATEEQKAEFEQIAGQKELIKAMMAGKMSFTFNANGSCTSTNELQGEKEEKTGTWSVENNKLTISDEGAEKRVTEILLEKTTFKMFVPKGVTKGLITTLIFEKKSKTK
jgi:Lipocalin-like domain